MDEPAFNTVNIQRRNSYVLQLIILPGAGIQGLERQWQDGVRTMDARQGEAGCRGVEGRARPLDPCGAIPAGRRVADQGISEKKWQARILACHEEL